MEKGICVVCQVQGSRVQHEVSGVFEDVEMCHWHLVSARSGLLATVLLDDVKRSLKPVEEKPKPAEKVDRPKVHIKLGRPMDVERRDRIIESIRTGRKQISIAKEFGVSANYVSQLKVRYVDGRTP
jgi:hypothetical protein